MEALSDTWINLKIINSISQMMPAQLTKKSFSEVLALYK